MTETNDAPPAPLNFPDSGFAVFNLHVNNAGERAMSVVRRLFPSDNAQLIALERDYKSGVMAIFQRDADDASRTFALLCWVYTNALDVARSETDKTAAILALIYDAYRTRQRSNAGAQRMVKACGSLGLSPEDTIRVLCALEYCESDGKPFHPLKRSW